MTWQRSIHISDDFLDTRDIVSLIDDLTEEMENDEEIEESETLEFWEGFAGEFFDEFGIRLAEAEQYEPILIARNYFVTYAQQLAEDIGAIDHDAGWPLGHIDWEGAARDLEMDYTTFEYDGYEFLIRSW